MVIVGKRISEFGPVRSPRTWTHLQPLVAGTRRSTPVAAIGSDGAGNRIPAWTHLVGTLMPHLAARRRSTALVNAYWPARDGTSGNVEGDRHQTDGIAPAAFVNSTSRTPAFGPKAILRSGSRPRGCSAGGERQPGLRPTVVAFLPCPRSRHEVTLRTVSNLRI